MSGRPKEEQSDEKRDRRIVARFTESEKALIERARQKLGLRYEVDVVREFTLAAVNDLLVSAEGNMAE